jgi:hypothetical protein
VGNDLDLLRSIDGWYEDTDEYDDEDSEEGWKLRGSNDCEYGASSSARG